MDLKDFSRWARQLGDRVEKNADHLVRTCALAIDGAVVIATPVDTGRARANWQVQLDNPATSTREPFSPGHEGSTGGDNARAAIEEGKGVIASYKGGRPNACIHITNNLPYIGRLNDGWSAQAPAAFVEKGIMVGVKAIRNAGGIVSRKPT